MLQIKNLTMTHKKDLRVIVQDFSCVLNDGDKAVIVGEEGNGKSTLLKWIYNPDLVSDYIEAAGERIVNRERMAYLPQELPEADKKKSLYEFFAEEPMFFTQTPKDLGRFANQFHLPPGFFYEEQKMGTLSGGEKVKAQIIRLMMTEPTVILMDEPSNDIDIETLEWLEKMIAAWQQTVVFISHDETLIEQTANMVIHIEQIRRKTLCRCTVAHMPYLQYIQERAAQFERQEQQAYREQREQKIRDEKFQRIYQSVEYAQNSITRQNPAKGRLLKKKMHAVKSMEHRFAREDASRIQLPEEEQAIYFELGDKECAVPAGKTVLTFSLDTLKTPDQTRVLAKDIFLRLKGSEKIAIVGRNGVGKTTLLRMIAQELLQRTDICAQYMPQNYEDLLMLAATPVDYLDQSGNKQERTRIRTFLGALRYTPDEMDHPIAELSGGQKAKILLLKMSMSGANVLVLDEPTRNFSALSAPVIRRMLAAFPGAIISISHDRKYVQEVCGKVYHMTENGLLPVDGFS